MNLYLKHYPFNEHPFIWSDFIELYTLSIAGGRCNEDQFVKLVQNNYSGKEAFPAESITALWTQILNHCSEKASLYAAHYPFHVEKASKNIQLKLIRTHPKQRLYLSMVIAAMVNYLPKEWHMHIAEDFSATCKEIFKSLMPEGTLLEYITAQLTSALTPEEIQNLIHLACGGNISREAQPLHRLSLSSMASANKKEKNASLQANILAWHPIGDKHDGIPIAVAHIESGIENWQNDPEHLSHLDEKIYAQHMPWAAYYFSPIDLYTAKQDWKIQQLPSRMILLDRYRILSLAENFFIYNNTPDIHHIEFLYQHIKETF